MNENPFSPTAYSLKNQNKPQKIATVHNFLALFLHIAFLAVVVAYVYLRLSFFDRVQLLNWFDYYFFIIPLGLLPSLALVILVAENSKSRVLLFVFWAVTSVPLWLAIRLVLTFWTYVRM